MSYAFRSFGDDSVDPCIATGPVEQPYASCVQQFGAGAFANGAPVLLIGPALAALQGALAKSPRPAIPPQPITGGHGSPYGARYAPVEWDGSSAAAWAAYMASTPPMASMTDGGRACDLGLCEDLRFNGMSWGIYLNNAFVFAGAESGPDYFGGPVLEYLNFKRLLRFLHQRTTLVTGYLTEPRLDRALAVAEMNLGKLMTATTRDKTLATLTATQPSLLVRGVIGNPPYPAHEWLNFLRYQVQRCPPDPTTGYSACGPYGLIFDVTPLEHALVRNDLTKTIGPGDWLRLVLDLLAPGWTTWVPPKKTGIVVAKGAAAGAKPAVAAGGTVIVAAVGVAAVGALLYALL